MGIMRNFGRFFLLETSLKLLKLVYTSLYEITRDSHNQNIQNGVRLGRLNEG